MKDSVEKTMDTAVEQVQQEVDSGREPWYRSSRKTRILILVYFIEFLLFTALAWFVHFNPVLPIDVAHRTCILVSKIASGSPHYRHAFGC